MSTSYRSIETMIYAYFLKRWGIGWSLTKIKSHYDNLSFRDSIDEANLLNEYFKSEIKISTKEQIDNKPERAFSVRKLAIQIAHSWADMEDEILAKVRKKEIKEDLLVDVLNMMNEGGPT